MTVDIEVNFFFIFIFYQLLGLVCEFICVIIYSLLVLHSLQKSVLKTPVGKGGGLNVTIDLEVSVSI